MVIDLWFQRADLAFKPRQFDFTRMIPGCDPSGKFLYLPVIENDGIEKLRGFSVNPLSGELTALPGSPFPLGTNVIPFDVTVTP